MPELTVLNTKERCAMNGLSNGKIVLDSNIVIGLLNKTIMLPVNSGCKIPQYFVSVVTEIEALAHPRATPKTERDTRALLSTFNIIPLNDDVKDMAIKIRRASTAIKLPDAIVAATAVVLGASLVTQDSKLLALQWHGLSVVNNV